MHRGQEILFSDIRLDWFILFVKWEGLSVGVSECYGYQYNMGIHTIGHPRHVFGRHDPGAKAQRPWHNLVQHTSIHPLRKKNALPVCAKVERRRMTWHMQSRWTPWKGLGLLSQLIGLLFQIDQKRLTNGICPLFAISMD